MMNSPFGESDLVAGLFFLRSCEQWFKRNTKISRRVERFLKGIWELMRFNASSRVSINQTF